MDKNTSHLDYFLIDIGNSTTIIKIASRFYSYEYDDKYLLKIQELIDNNYRPFVVISSVNKELEEIICNLLDKNKIKIFGIEEMLNKQTLIDFSSVEGMGCDRKLGLFGAICLEEPPLFTVDCGTAITLNFIDKDKKSLGGAIFPGANTQAKAMNCYTSLLPLVDIITTEFSEEYFIATNTEQAIKLGILASCSGGIVNIANTAIMKNKLENVNAIFTGGFGNIMYNICKPRLKVNSSINNVECSQNLVIQGIEQVISMFESNGIINSSKSI